MASTKFGTPLSPELQAVYARAEHEYFAPILHDNFVERGLAWLMSDKFKAEVAEIKAKGGWNGKMKYADA